MADLLGRAVDQFALYWLVAGRIAGVFVSMPVFGHRGVPVAVRAGAILLTSLVLLPMVAPPPAGMPSELPPYAAMFAREVVFGLAMGFVVALVFAAAEMAGQLLDVEMGFSMVNVIDPVFGQALPVIGNLFNLLAMLLFLLVDGHHTVLAALLESFRRVPPGLGGIGDAGLRIGLEEAAWVFMTAVKIAAPVLGVLFLTSVVLGLVAKAAPQLNIFVVGLPVKMAVGFIGIAVAMPVTMLAIRELFPVAYRQMVLLFQTVQ